MIWMERVPTVKPAENSFSKSPHKLESTGLVLNVKLAFLRWKVDFMWRETGTLYEKYGRHTAGQKNISNNVLNTQLACNKFLEHISS